MPAPLRRRVFVGFLGLSATSAVAGCTLDGGTAPAPSGPDATQAALDAVPDMAILLRARDRAVQLAGLAGAIEGDTKPRRRVLKQARADLEGQAQVLERLLVAGGLPDDAASTSGPPDGGGGTAGPDGSGSTRASTDAAADLRELGRQAATDVGPTSLSALASTSSANLTMLVSLTAWRPVVYGFQVLGARSSGDERVAFTTALTRLEALSAQLTSLAGEHADPPPLGYTLDGDPGTAEGREAMGAALLASLTPAVLTGTQGYTGDTGSVTGSVRLLAEVLDLGRPWGAQEEGPFPGMDLA